MIKKLLILGSIFLLMTTPTIFAGISGPNKQIFPTPTELRPGDFMIMRPKFQMTGVVFHLMVYVDDNGAGNSQRWVHSQKWTRECFPGVSISNVPGIFYNTVLWEDFRYYYVQTASPVIRNNVVELLTTHYAFETSWGQTGWKWIYYQDTPYQTYNNWNPYDNLPHANVFYCSELLWAAYMNLTNGYINVADKALNHSAGGSPTEWINCLMYDVFGEEYPEYKWENENDIDVKEFPNHPTNAPFPEGA